MRLFLVISALVFGQVCAHRPLLTERSLFPLGSGADFDPGWNLTSRLPWSVCDFGNYLMAAPRYMQFSRTCLDKIQQVEADKQWAVAHSTRYHDPIFLDIGCNLGHFTAPAAAAGIPVICIEPVRLNAEMVAITVHLNRWENRVALVRAVASDVDGGSANITIPRGNEDNAALSAGAATLNVHGQPGTETVPVVSVDSLLDSRPDIRRRVKMVKIDVQGHELKVLQGMKRFLHQATDAVLLIENDEALAARSGHSVDQVHKLMREAGYNGFCHGEPSVACYDVEWHK